MSINQRVLRNWRFATLAEIKAVANANIQTLCYCDQTQTLYHYDPTSGATADDQYILTTGAGGASRWVGIGGKYVASAEYGAILAYGAQVGGGDAGKYFAANGEAKAGVINALDASSEIVCPLTGTLYALGWHATSSVTGAVLKVIKNGGVAYTTAGLNGFSGVVQPIGVSVAAGDLIALEYDAVGTGASMGKSNHQLFVRGA